MLEGILTQGWHIGGEDNTYLHGSGGVPDVLRWPVAGRSLFLSLSFLFSF